MAETTRPKNTEYLKKRLEELGINEKQNTFTREWINEFSSKDDDGKTVIQKTKQKRDYQIFDADEEGNIVISYFNLDGQPYRWKKEDTKMPRDFIRKRLKDPKTDFKYWQEKGSPQFPFFNPGIIRKYKLATAPPPEENPDQTKLFQGKVVKVKKPARKKVKEPDPENGELGQIHTLFLVEGEFKSYKGYLCGLDIVGLPSIHGFYNGDVKGKLHEDLEELIVKCKVKKIVFLQDADVLSLNWAEDKDLHKRPASFYGSIKSFRESLQLLLDDEKVNLELVYWMHIHTKFIKEDAKGLDDLFCKFSSVTMEIIEDLFQLSFARKYFVGKQINDLNKDVQGYVYRYLGLQDEQEFYKTYKDFIGAREFKFKRRKYIYDAESKEVKFMRHEDVDKFMRIGPHWFKMVTRVNKYNETEEYMVPWKISEIERDYKRKFPDFVNEITRYDDLCNEPAWNGDYKNAHYNCYNVCRPLKWIPKEGSITNTVQFLKHIFQGNGQVILDDQGRVEKEESYKGDPFTIFLDYFTIMFKHPKHMLPVPILVSPENNTGKSTLLKWMQMIYGSNMTIVGNEQFKMKFNSHYITKFIIGIDESFLEVDKKAEKERLKQLVTADRAFVEFKGTNVMEIPYYAKVIMCSNDADRVMKIENGESRWFVVRVPVIKKKDPDLELKMKAEAEAFLHFIQNREIFHKRVDRLWFDAEDFITDQFKIIVETTKNRVDRVFEEWITEQFLLFKMPVLRYSGKYLTEVFNDPKNSKYKIDSIDLKAYLTGKNMEPEETQWVKIPKGFKQVTSLSTDAPGTEPTQPVIEFISAPCRPYVFRAEEWLKPDQLKELQSLQSVTGQPDLKTLPEGQDSDMPF